MMKKDGNHNKLLPTLLMCALAIANIGLARSDIWTAGNGIPIDIGGMDAAAYGVEAVSQSRDGSYLVNSTAYGFQSDIEVLVSFSADGQIIQTVEVIAQGETDGIGSKITEPAFLAQFADVKGLVSLAGQELPASSPKSIPEPAATGSEVNAGAASGVWNAGDKSPESNAMRAMYDAGLLASAYQDEPLKTVPADYLPADRAVYDMMTAGLLTSDEFIPMEYLDKSPEGEAMRALYGAGLLNSACQGEPLTAPIADYSAEELAAVRLRETGLMITAENLSPVSDKTMETVNAVTLDGVSGATISSAAVVTAVDNGYYFINENIIK